MNTAAPSTEASNAMTQCPMHAPAAAASGLDPHAWLVFPLNKRAIVQYSSDGEGAAELHLYWGDKEISFDEPELFAFGEALARQSHFMAADATRWGPGYEWAQVQELLEVLLDEGVLERASADHVPAATPAGARPSPLPAAQTTTARSWFECEAITRELTGHAIELGHLELVIPVFRIAHMALDSDGRQVGEANVFPKALRLDVPTNWRACIYPGSRYQDERPMNVSALKSMRAHWPQMMAVLLQVREAYLHRYPAARNGWTVGDVERLSTLVLALPTWMLMKSTGRVANGDLHPVLSNLFRVADGLRMTTHQMLFVPVGEATLSPEAAVTSEDIHAYAERNHSFASTHGVCAGPKAMIDEFLAVLLDGATPRDGLPATLDAQVQAALAELDAAFDYGLLGLQAHAVVFSLWPVMTRTYEQLAKIAQEWSGAPSPAVERFREYTADKLAILRNETLHATEEWRVNRERVYAHIHEECAAGLGDPVGVSLPRRIAATRRLEHAAIEVRLEDLLCRRFPGTCASASDVTRMRECLMRYFVQAQAILDVASGIQARINALAGREAPKRAFSATDIDVHVLLQGSEARRLPHLLNELQGLLGFRAEITRSAIVIDAPHPMPAVPATASEPNLPAQGRQIATCESTTQEQ